MGRGVFCLELQRGQVGNIKNNENKYIKQENRVIEKRSIYHWNKHDKDIISIE